MAGPGGDQVDVDPNYRRRKCQNADGSPKKAYRSRSWAIKMAQRTNRDGNGGGGQPVREYLCTAGGRHWHVGHAGLAEEDEWAEHEQRRLAKRKARP